MLKIAPGRCVCPSHCAGHCPRSVDNTAATVASRRGPASRLAAPGPLPVRRRQPSRLSSPDSPPRPARRDN